jgi:hypothetical protein
MTLPQATTGRLLSWADERDAGLVISSPESTEPVTHGPGLLVRGAFLASVEGGLRTGGRLAVSPGQQGSRGRLTADELRGRCAIDLVEGIGGTPVEDGTPIDTKNFLRPIWRVRPGRAPRATCGGPRSGSLRGGTPEKVSV